MSDAEAPIPRPADFDALESAVRETARGRWFLAEFARRQRAEDTQKVLAAIAELGVTLAVGRAPPGSAVRGELADLARMIVQARAEVAALLPLPEDSSAAMDPLEAVLRGIERASGEIRDAAGDIHESAWRLREADADPDACAAIERLAVAIYTACGAQDLCVNRVAKVADLVRTLDQRIAAMLGSDVPEPAGAEAPPPLARPVPAPAARSPRADGHPSMSAATGAAGIETSPVPSKAGAVPPLPSPNVSGRMAALAKIDALDLREKLRRFT